MDCGSGYGCVYVYGRERAFLTFFPFNSWFCLFFFFEIYSCGKMPKLLHTREREGERSGGVVIVQIHYI
jgi:hypothetical protein